MKLIPQNLTGFKTNSIFIRIFFYIMGLVLGAVLIVACISYWNSTQLMIREVKNNNMLVLEQAQVIIDSEIHALSSTAMQVSLDSRMNKALYLSLEDSYMESDQYRDMIAYLNSIKANNDYISNIWVYFKKSDVVVNSEGKYSSQLFLTKVCKYNTNIDWDKIFQKYSGFHSVGKQNVEYDLNKTSVITFLKSLPVNDLTPKGTMVVNLDERFIDKSMGEPYREGKVVINYIVDAQKNVVYTNENAYKGDKTLELANSVLNSTLGKMRSGEGTIDSNMGGKPFTVQYIKSSENDWKYISVTPTDYISRQANSIRDVTLLVVLISMVMGALLTYILVKRLYRPISDILNYISIMSDKKLNSQEDGRTDEFKFINRMISYVYRENESLKDSFKKNYPILREKYINDILNGRVSNENHREISGDIGIDMPFPLFQVIVFEIDEYASESLKMHGKQNLQYPSEMDSVANNALGINAKCYSVQKDDLTLVSIINANSVFYESDKMNEYLNTIRKYFKNNYEITFTIGIGRYYSSMEKCSMSFIEALHAHKYKIVKGQDTVIYIDEVKNVSGNSFEYHLEKEKQLVTILKSGDMATADQILQQIFSDNLDKRSMTPETINNLFNALVGTAIRAIYEMQSTVEKIFGKETDIYAEMTSRSVVEEKRSYIGFVYKSIAEYADNRKNNQNTRIFEKIQKYIASNYHKELSLAKVAEVVGLSPSYLSFIFKEASGMNFVDFVNEYRLEKAKELLNSTSMTIAEIAESVGYINANTFSKTFKKYVGVAPGQFRE